MTHLRTFGRFWYDFIIGDDWRLALGVTLSIAVAYAITHELVDAWWLLPLGVAALLGLSVHHATRPQRR
jgi:hypothetical protein